MNDTVDKLVIFLAKRDGIDKLVKTFQYVSKLTHWHAEIRNPHVAQRAKNWEVASGLSRKAFRTGRFLTGFNVLRRNPGPTPTFRFLAVLANAGEMVYWFFDHFLWLSRIGAIDTTLARRMSFISAFGEAFGYIFFVISDSILIKQGLAAQGKLLKESEASRDEQQESIKKIRYCSHCKGTLSMSNYSSMDGVLYCKPHFEQLFKETGSFSKNFQTAGKQQEMARAPSKLSAMFSGTQDKCATCNKTAYPLEKHYRV